MIIKFKLEDYEDVCDEYEKVFEQEDVVDVEEGDDCLVVRTRRIIIPALHVSFREAEWLARNPDADEEDDEWETQCSVTVEYEENEKDPSKYISYLSCDMIHFAAGMRSKYGFTSEDIPQLDCYIDTSEFINE